MRVKEAKESHKRPATEELAKKKDIDATEVESANDGSLEGKFTVNVLDNPLNLNSINKAATKYKEK